MAGSFRLENTGHILCHLNIFISLYLWKIELKLVTEQRVVHIWNLHDKQLSK